MFLKKIAIDYERANFRGLGSNSLIGIPLAFLANPGFRSVCFYRLQQYVQSKSRNLLTTYLAYAISNLNHFVNGAEFLPGCDFGDGLVVKHPTGIVVGSGVMVGTNCTLQHGVTFGVKDLTTNAHTRSDYPQIGDNCVFGTHAVVIGSIKIGHDVIVGAHTLISKSISSGSTVVGVNDIVKTT